MLIVEHDAVTWMPLDMSLSECSEIKVSTGAKAPLTFSKEAATATLCFWACVLWLAKTAAMW